MKMSKGKKFAMLLTLLLMVPFIWYQSEALASAATPTFVKSKIELVGEGETYQLEIKDKVEGSSYKWTSSNTKAVTVSKTGLVTTVGKGSSTIKSKITYPSGKTKTISCQVTVTIPATGIKINNAVEVNGAHILKVGEEMNFNRDIFPSNSSDKTYWSYGGGDISCISINYDNGVVKGIKAGKVILKASAVKTLTAEDAVRSIINDAIIIEVKAPSATVGSAEIVGSTELKVVFDSPIDKNTVIGANNTLLDSIEITMRKNVKGVLAKDPGTFTASLSADNMILTINSSDMFDGEYGISLNKKIKTVSGIAIEEYYKQLSYVDNVPPFILGAPELDDTGLVATIRFNEAVDFTDFKVSNATLIPTGKGSTAEQTTYSTLNNRLNYVASEDKKSLTINLSKIASSDYGKTFSVIFSGIKDMSGNVPASFTLTAYLTTDITPKPQARPILPIIRTSYNTLTVTFDRAIEFGGYASVNNGPNMLGTVDTVDKKKVHYTLNESDAALTGLQTVSIGFWRAYNVIAGDSYAQSMHSFSNVSFAVSKENPVLLAYNFNVETSILSLTFNKDVTLTSNSGIFSTTLITTNDEIRSGTNINYSKVDSSDSKVINLKITNISLIGFYSFTLDAGFVSDSFRNVNLAGIPISIDNTSGTARELPPPYAITQSSTDLSKIYIEFYNKLDVPSAMNINNYKIPGIEIKSVEVYKNTAESGATVILTVAADSIDVTMERPVEINGVKGYDGSYSEIVGYSKDVLIKDNKKPYLLEPPVYDKTAKNIIRLNFNEDIAGTMSVKVTQIVPYSIDYVTNVEVIGKSVVITLGSIPQNNAVLKIDILENKIKDINGNESTPLDTMYITQVAY